MIHDPERILITGYSGFVAPYVAVECSHQYPAAQLFGMVHESLRPSSLNNLHVRQLAEAAMVTKVQGDVTDSEQLRLLLHETRPDLIFHLAAVSSVATSWQAPDAVLAINTAGFIRLAEAIRAERLATRVLVIGSGEQYGLVRPDQNPVREDTESHPMNPYAVAKVSQDLFALMYHNAYGLDVVRARPFNHFGPAQGADFVIASFARQIAQMEAGLIAPTLMVGNLSAQRDFLPVSDVARAYLALARSGQAGEAYNIGSGVARSIESVLDRMLGMADIEVKIRVDPERFRPVEVPILCADTTKIQCDTGWRVEGGIDEALHATLDYWRTTIQVESRP